MVKLYGKGLLWSNATDPCHIKEGLQLNQGDTGQIYDLALKKGSQIFYQEGHPIN